MKQVVLFANTLDKGGAERVCANLAQGFRQAGHRPRLVLVRPVIEYPLDGIPFDVLGSRGLWARVREFRRLLENYSREAPVDLVLANAPRCERILRRCGTAKGWMLVHSPVSRRLVSRRRFAGIRARIRLARLSHNFRGQRLVAVSRSVAADIRKLALPCADLRQIYNPFDFDELERQARQPLENPLDDDYILHLGRPAPLKRQDLLLEAFIRSGVPGHLVFLGIGEGEIARVLRLRAAGAGVGDRVHLVAWADNPYPWISGARLTALSSDSEGLPSVLIESLALGTPVVSTRCEGSEEILAGKLGDYLSEPGDAAGLARNLQRMYYDPVDVSRDDLRRFEQGQVIREYLKLMDPAS